MVVETIEQTREWIAFNRIRKICTEEQRETLKADFRLLEDFICEHTSDCVVNEMVKGYEYLRKLSPEAKTFVLDLLNRGELNIYHSMMMVIATRREETKEDIRANYYKRFSRKREYVKENWDLFCEIFDLCWEENCN